MKKLLFLIILTLTFAAIYVVTYAERFSDDVWTLTLAGNCHLDYHANIHAIALACPGVDYMRLWPVKQPWQETLDPLPNGCRVGMLREPIIDSTA